MDHVKNGSFGNRFFIGLKKESLIFQAWKKSGTLASGRPGSLGKFFSDTKNQ